MKAMRGRIALPKALRAKRIMGDRVLCFARAFGVLMRPRSALTTSLRGEIIQLRLLLPSDQPMHGKRFFGSKHKNLEPPPAFKLKRSLIFNSIHNEKEI